MGDSSEDSVPTASAPGGGADGRTTELGPEGSAAAPFWQSLSMLLLRARESVLRPFRHALRANDVTEQQWRILKVLAGTAGMEVSELARATFLLGPSLSRILRDLDARGLIERRQDLHDLRRARIAIAPRGAALLLQLAPYADAIEQRVATALGPQRMKELQGLLVHLEATLAEGVVVTRAEEPAASPLGDRTD